MKRRGRVLLILLAFGVLAVVAVFTFSDDGQPHYRGRSLSHWIAVYRTGPDWAAFRRASTMHGRVTGTLSAETLAANEALRQIGTNALPSLLRWIRYRPPEWRRKLWVEINGLLTDPDESDGSVADWLVNTEAEARAYAAAVAFQMLGPEASPAIPELVRLIMQTNDLDASSRALNAFVGVERDASPLLLILLANSNAPAPFRQEAAHWIGWTASATTNASAYVPMLVACLKDPNSIIAYEAAKALGRFALEPEICVPALAACLTDSFVCYPAIHALGQFGTNARPVLPALQNTLNHRDPLVRAAAAKAIRSIASDVLPEEPRQ